MASAQLDLADLLAHGAAQLRREAPDLVTAPAVASRLTRVLGGRLPCLAVIHWVCPVCHARSVSRWSCGPRCATCRAGAPPSANLLRQIPPLPVRHWVLSLPSPQRHEFAGDPRSEAAVVRAFVQAIFAGLRGADGERSAGCGAVVVVHRSGSALDLNFHVHALVLDGVFHRADDGPQFVARTLDAQALAAVAREVHQALARVPVKPAQDAALTHLQRGARARRTVGRAAVSSPAPGLATTIDGLRLFAGVPLPADDRAALRRLCDYVTRPASARLARVTGTPDALLLPLPPQPGGATHAPLSAREVVARLIATTPDEPAVSVRTFGVLAPRAAHTWQLGRGRQLELPAMSGAGSSRAPRVRPPRCTRCDVALAALAVEDRSDPPAHAR